MAGQPRDDIGAGELPEGEPDFFRRWGEEAVRLDEEFVARPTRPASEVHSFVIADWFLAFLRLHARFGLFSFGPISIHVPVIEEIMRREAEHLGPHEGEFVRFSQALERERVRLGRPRIEYLHSIAEPETWRSELQPFAETLSENRPATPIETMIVQGARVLTDRIRRGELKTILSGIGQATLMAWLAAHHLRAEGGVKVFHSQ